MYVIFNAPSIEGQPSRFCEIKTDPRAEEGDHADLLMTNGENGKPFFAQPSRFVSPAEALTDFLIWYGRLPAEQRTEGEFVDGE
jgi:hypothetical protein